MSRKTPASPDWFRLSLDGMQLWSDAAAVVWLRSARLAQGGTCAAAEAERMVTEKLQANAEFAIDMATGAAGSSVEQVTERALGFYGKRVRANRKRLTR